MKRYNPTPISFYSFSFLALFLLLNPGCATHERLLLIAPGVLPHTTRDMKTAGFWISRHPDPDMVILNREEIKELNARTFKRNGKGENDFDRSVSGNGQALKKTLESAWEDIKRRNLFAGNGRPAREEFFSSILTNMDLEAIPDKIDVRFGLVSQYANQRVLPTENGLNEISGDIDFDELQNSALDVGTPVRVLHQSRDGEWLYVQGQTSDGWVVKESIVIDFLENLETFLQPKDFVVVVSPKADIFQDERQTLYYYGYAQMGTRFPLHRPRLTNINYDIIEILLPIHGDGDAQWERGFVNREDVHLGYLPYTPKNILKQAFKLLNAPYGWGGMYGEQDCSRFLQEVFSTVGIILPRNSSEQAKVGLSLAGFSENSSDQDKLEILNTKAVGGITILPMKGHIMLYLGMVDGRPFAIHATWGYRENVRGEDVVRVLNRVVVSDLSLGEGSKKGSLLKRVSAVQLIAK